MVTHRCRALAGLSITILLGCGGGATGPVSSPSPTAAPTSTGAPSAPASVVAAPAANPPATTAEKASPPARPRPSIRAGFSSGSGRNATERPKVQPTPFRVDELPVASLPDPPDWQSKAPNVAAGEAAPDVLVQVDAPQVTNRSDDYIALVKLKDAAYANIRVGTWTGWTGGVFGTTGGANVRCGTSTNYAPTLPAQWTALRPSGSAVEVSTATGWFDRAACKASAIHRGSVVAKPIAPGGLVLAYRSCGATCAKRQELVLVLPRSQMLVATGTGGDATRETSAFSRVTLPLRKGGGGSMMARIAMPDVLAWQKAFPSLSPDRAYPKNKSAFSATVLVGVEISQGVEDAEPIAVVYFEES